MRIDSQLSAKSAENLAVARHLIDCYFAAREGLRELGILRSERTLQGDYAEWLVAEMLDLELAESAVAKGVDARDAQGRTYQVKARIVKDSAQNTSFDFRDIEEHFDWLVAVLFNPTLDVLAVLRVPYDVVRERGLQFASRFSFRWTKSCAADPRVERLYWKEPPP